MTWPVTVPAPVVDDMGEPVGDLSEPDDISEPEDGVEERPGAVSMPAE